MTNETPDWGTLFDKVLGSLPLGQISVWGENVLQTFWPEFATLKTQIAYFVQYAEAVETGSNTGATKKQQVLNYVMTDVDKYIPSWVPPFFVTPVVSATIDAIVDYLNKNVPSWTTDVRQYFLNPTGTPTITN